MLDSPYPIITCVTAVGGDVFVSGQAQLNSQVELYRVAPDPLGYGEGRTWVGSVPTDGMGYWIIKVKGSGGCFTAIQNKPGPFGQEAAEFGPYSGCAYLPVVAKQ